MTCTKSAQKPEVYYSYIYLVFIVSDSFLACFISTIQFKNVHFYPRYETGLQKCMRLLTKFLGDYLKNAKKLKIICTVSSVLASGLCGFKTLVGCLVLGALLVWGLGGNVRRDRPLGLSCWASSHGGRSIPKKQKQVPLRLPQQQVHHIIWDNKSQRSAQMQMMEKGAFVSSWEEL